MVASRGAAQRELGLLLLHDRYPIAAWPPLAAFALFAGTGVAAGFVADTVSVQDPVRPFVASVVLLVLAAFSALLVRVLPGHQPEQALVAIGSVAIAALISFGSGLAEAASRPWSALALAAVAGFTWWGRNHLPSSLRRALTLASAIVLGFAVGFAIAPWTAERHWWQGLLAGVALAGLLVALAELDRGNWARAEDAPTGVRGLPALLAAAAGLFLWLTAMPVADAPTAYEGQWALTLALVGPAVACWAESLRRRLPTWSVWPSGALLLAALLPLSRSADLAVVWAPEVYGLALGVVGAATGTLLVAAPAGPYALLVVVGPAWTLLLAPTVVAMVQDAADRWVSGGGPLTAAFQVRVVMLLLVGAVLLAVGAWRGWAGLVVPAVATLVVVAAVQLIDLGRFLPQWVSFAVAGGLLLLAGARWEKVQTLGHHGTR